MKRVKYIILLLAITLTAIPLPSYARIQNCTGMTCGQSGGKTYYSDEYYNWMLGPGGFGNEILKRDRDMFPNFHRWGAALANAQSALADFLAKNTRQGQALEGMLRLAFGPGMQEHFWGEMAKLPPSSPGPEDDLARGIGMFGTIVGTTSRGRLANLADDFARMGGRAARYADEAVDVMASPVTRNAPSPTYPRSAIDRWIEKGHLRFEMEPVPAGSGEVRIVAMHGDVNVGRYEMIRRSETDLSLMWVSTDEMYRNGGLYTRAARGYLEANPGVTRLTASFLEENTVRDVLAAAARGEDITGAFQRSLMGHVNAKLGFPVVEHISIQRDVAGEHFLSVISGAGR